MAGADAPPVVPVTVELEAVERDLRERGLPFALATVVWRRSPSSAKVGAGGS